MILQDEPAFAATTTTDESQTILLPHGELDIATAAPFLAAIEEAAVAGLPVVIDLSAVTFIDSSGAGALVRGYKLLGDGRLTVRAPREQARRLFEIVGLDQIFPLDD